jgi:hypothetical protein
MPNTGVQVLGSADAVSVTIPIPHVPQQIAIAAAVAAGLLVMILLLKIFRRFSAIRKDDVKQAKKTKLAAKPKKTSPGVMVEELHKALIEEMKGTSRQNTIMIYLTIVFIVASVGASIFSAQLGKLLAAAPSMTVQIVSVIKAFFVR